MRLILNYTFFDFTHNLEIMALVWKQRWIIRLSLTLLRSKSRCSKIEVLHWWIEVIGREIAIRHRTSVTVARISLSILLNNMGIGIKTLTNLIRSLRSNSLLFLRFFLLFLLLNSLIGSKNHTTQLSTNRHYSREDQIASICISKFIIVPVHICWVSSKTSPINCSNKHRNS